MPRHPMFWVRIPPEIRAAAEAHCKAKGLALSRLMLLSLLKEIGRSDLVELIREPHRPKAKPKKRPAKKRAK